MFELLLVQPFFREIIKTKINYSTTWKTSVKSIQKEHFSASYEKKLISRNLTLMMQAPHRGK